MNDSSKPRVFRTLKGAMSGEDSDEPTYFAFMASLRIHGDNLPFEEISARLGVKPTMMRRKGERRSPESPVYLDDAWHFQPALPESAPLEQHIDALWQICEASCRVFEVTQAQKQSRRVLRIPIKLRPCGH